MVPPLSGQCNSCQRQLCAGCGGRVSGPQDQSEVLTVSQPSGGARRRLATEASTFMSDVPMTKDLIRYDLLVQDALKGVVRKVLGDAAKSGLPGDHHFYISFWTDFPGVRLSQRLRDKYPQEMTVVLQHQFWDLGVTDHGFEVGLSFSGVPERLLIPFEAVTGFFDPSVQFGLKFEVRGE